VSPFRDYAASSKRELLHGEEYYQYYFNKKVVNRVSDPQAKLVKADPVRCREALPAELKHDPLAAFQD